VDAFRFVDSSRLSYRSEFVCFQSPKAVNMYRKQEQWTKRSIFAVKTQQHNVTDSKHNATHDTTKYGCHDTTEIIIAENKITGGGYAYPCQPPPAEVSAHIVAVTTLQSGFKYLQGYEYQLLWKSVNFWRCYLKKGDVFVMDHCTTKRMVGLRYWGSDFPSYSLLPSPWEYHQGKFWNCKCP